MDFQQKFSSLSPSFAAIKAEYLVQKCAQNTESIDIDNLEEEIIESEIEPKKLKLIDEDESAAANGETKSEDKPAKLTKRQRRGQNKSKDRPRPFKIANKLKLCPTLFEGEKEEGVVKCTNSKCPFLHDVGVYIASLNLNSNSTPCYLYTTYGKCPRGLSCIFLNSHLDRVNKKNLINEELWINKNMKKVYDASHGPIISQKVQQELRHRTFDFGNIEAVCEQFKSNQNTETGQDHDNSTNTPEIKPKFSSGPLTDEDLIPLRPQEIKTLDWSDKLYLSPLTTVGNLPFRRLCVEYGADITCSEMSLATSILQGQPHEFALHRRHPSEKFWGVQLCGNNSFVLTKASHVLRSIGVDYDFVDLNMGCPLEGIYQQGSGSGLMNRVNKFESIVKSMTSVLSAQGKTFTVKMRTGIKSDKNSASSFIKICKENGVGMVTLHGRSREQRYTKYADWNYISNCAKDASPMPLYGNGDVLSWEEYNAKKTESVAGVMIGRGALLKPWLFQEIKEQRNIDMNSTCRMEILKKYCNYGLDHWGSDSQGAETTRRFLLEWLSFYHRYIPFGLLESPPQLINQRPSRYTGRDEMETLLASSSAADWIKISEHFLGPVPVGFEFVPKHRANAWSE